MSEPKRTLTLDFSKWRCGDRSNFPCRTGDGNTELLNDKNFSCCLGQFALQLEPECFDRIHGATFPRQLRRKIPLLTDSEGWDSELSKAATNVNDYAHTTVWEKARMIQKLFAEENCEVQLVNFPPEPTPERSHPQ